VGARAGWRGACQTGPMSDPVDLYRRAMDEFDRRVEAIAPAQWGRSTPCSEWDVRALVRHLVYENLWVPPLFDGKTVAEVGDQFEGDILGDDPQAAWAASKKTALDAVSRPGAMVETVHLSFGDVSGAEYTMQLTTDLLVHSWDLAMGINADRQLDAEVAEACLVEARKAEDMLRASGLFGDKVTVPESAGPQQQLLGLLGRTP
jgi:uncharacterized protein (TIGR03086 family)